MSAVNDKNSMTSVQVKRHLKSIHTDKHEIKSRLLKVVEQFQCLDHVARSIGIVKEGFSFTNRISWKPVLSKLDRSESDESKEGIDIKEIVESLSSSSNQLENELIPQLQKWRNEWMIQVVLIEFIFLTLLTMLVAGATHVQGMWSLSNISFPIQAFLYERPVFIAIAGLLVFIAVVVMHFSIRNFVAEQLARKLDKESSEFDFTTAFLRNTRIQHSIFRPDIIGWGWFNKKCLLRHQQ